MSYKDYRDMDLLRQMENEMQRLAEETMRGFFTDIPAPNKFWQPRVDVHELPDTLLVKVELCGVKPERLNVSLSHDDRLLTVAGERHESDEERSDRIRCYQLEIYFGAFERQIMLPPNVRIDRDAITANYRDGFLIVEMPKLDKEPLEARTIVISE